jgi:hypothetical protein
MLPPENDALGGFGILSKAGPKAVRLFGSHSAGRHSLSRLPAATIAGMSEAILPALGVMFAAVCVWLTVRIINRKERWAKRTLAGVIGLPVMYVLSVGPMTRLVVHYPVPAWVRHAYRPAYAPLVWVTQRSTTANYVYGANLLLWNDPEELFPPPASAAAPPIPASTTAPTAPSPPDSN